MKTKVALVALLALVVTAPAVSQASLRPEPAPQAKAKHHKARWDHRPYVYKEIWIASDGSKIYATCKVNPRTGVTNCWITKIIR